VPSLARDIHVAVRSLAGRADRWSEIDRDIRVGDDVEPVEVAANWTRWLYEALPVVHHFETAFGATLVSGLLLDSALEIDLAFDAVSGVTLWEPAPCSTAAVALLMRSGASALVHGAGEEPHAPPAGEARHFVDFFDYVDDLPAEELAAVEPTLIGSLDGWRCRTVTGTVCG
jgi:hypothetical protein